LRRTTKLYSTPSEPDHRSRRCALGQLGTANRKNQTLLLLPSFHHCPIVSKSWGLGADCGSREAEAQGRSHNSEVRRENVRFGQDAKTRFYASEKKPGTTEREYVLTLDINIREKRGGDVIRAILETHTGMILQRENGRPRTKERSWQHATERFVWISRG